MSSKKLLSYPMATIAYRRSRPWSHNGPLLSSCCLNSSSAATRYGQRGDGRRFVSTDASSQNIFRSSRPRRIILVRHGESLGNVDESTYVTTPDWKVPLTARGREQAREAGRRLQSIVVGDDPGEGPHNVFLYYSSYRRTVETFREIEGRLRGADGINIIAASEEPRISEQQFGNFQNVDEVRAAKADRIRFGRFYYRFRSGESGLDVYSRVSSFISTLVRDCYQYRKAGYDLDRTDVIVVTHGLSLRLFLMRWFQFGVEEFEDSNNPENADIVVMEKKCNTGEYRWYQIDPVLRERLNLPHRCGPASKIDRPTDGGDDAGF